VLVSVVGRNRIVSVRATPVRGAAAAPAMGKKSYRFAGEKGYFIRRPVRCPDKVRRWRNGAVFPARRGFESGRNAQYHASRCSKNLEEIRPGHEKTRYY